MKTKYCILAAALIVFSLIAPSPSFSQGMPAPYRSGASGAGMGSNAATLQNDGHTAQEEAEGKALWLKIQAKEIACSSLTTDNFAALGEYFMGQTAGASHEAMNSMMTQMMGSQGEEQTHIAIGKRMSGCEPNAALPQGMTGMLAPYRSEASGAGMNGSGMMGGFGSGMMGWSAPWGATGWITLILLWILMASASAYFIRRLRK